MNIKDGIPILRNAVETGVETARKVGVPVDGIKQTFDATVKPYVMRKMAENMIRFVRRTGFRVRQMVPGYVEAEMPLKGNENHIGTMYAGAMFTLAELPGGLLTLSTFDSKRYYPIVKEMTIRYLKLAKTDLRLEYHLNEVQIAALEAEADEKGKADFELDGELVDRNGEVVATTHGKYQMRRVRR